MKGDGDEATTRTETVDHGVQRLRERFELPVDLDPERLEAPRRRMSAGGSRPAQTLDQLRELPCAKNGRLLACGDDRASDPSRPGLLPIIPQHARDLGFAGTGEEIGRGLP